MSKKIVVIGIVIVILLGARAVLQNQASDTLEKAQALYEDDKYTSALAKLDTIDTLYFWTKAGKESHNLRDEIEDKIERIREKQMKEMKNQIEQQQQEDVENQRESAGY